MRQDSSLNLQNRDKCLVLLSGGLDSVTATYWAVNQGYNVEVLFFDMNHTTKDRCLECVMDIADSLQIRLHVLKNPLSQKVLQEMTPISDILKKEVADDSNMSVFETIIMWLAISASYSLKSGINKIILGINADNNKMNPGLQAEFFNFFERLFNMWTGKTIKIITPFIEQEKSEIIKTGIKFGVPFHNTWSCIEEGNEKQCGKCDNCIIRINAFRSLGFKDPTEYEV